MWWEELCHFVEDLQPVSRTEVLALRLICCMFLEMDMLW